MENRTGPEIAAVWMSLDDLKPWHDNPRVNDAAGQKAQLIKEKTNE